MNSRRVAAALRAGGALASILHLAFSSAVIVGLSYFLGWGVVRGSGQGNDSPLHISYAYWLNQFFPDVPHWYPLQGGGMSLLHGYPVLPHLLVVATSRVSGLSVGQAYHLISFLTFPLTALGVYLFCWLVLRRQTVGLIAAVFYLLAPITWTWMYNWGFFPQQVALVLLPPALIAFDRAFEHQMDRRKTGRGRIWFVALVLLMAFASLSHMLVGSAAAVGMGLYVLFTSLTARRDARRATLWGGLKILLLLAVTLGLLLSAYMVPFYAYGQVANREGLNTPPEHQLHRLPIRELFGIAPVNPEEILTRMQFPLAVSLLALLGIGLSLLFAILGIGESRKALATGSVLVLGVVYALTPQLVALVLRVSPLLFSFVNFRSLLLLDMVLMPAMAGYGAWAIAYLVLHPEKLLRPRFSQPETPRKLRASLRPGLASLASLLLVGAILIPLGSTHAAIPGRLAYGPNGGGVNLGNVWNREPQGYAGPLGEQLAPENWPRFVLAQEDLASDDSWRLASVLPSDRPLRIDISPYMGRLAMDLVTYADASQINSYTYQANLIHAMWGYQQNVYYSREAGVAEYGNPQSLDNASQWFGTRYVLLHSGQDPWEMYQAAGWELVLQDGALQIWRDPDAPGMATASTRPAVLVVGRPEADAFMTLFRLANDGVLPYGEAFLVEGQPRVDRYRLEELALFDAVVLYGYDYRNSVRAWDTLEAYVEQGGSLFVDTGWEYWIPEWEFDQAPDVLPLERLTWTDYGMTSDYALGYPEASGELDVTQFKPLAWEGQPWTVSGAQPEDVRSWGRVVLSASGRPLVVAGEYGEGRVVWSGMNLIGHARYLGQNEEELQLLHNLLRWLTEDRPGADFGDPVLTRTHPDRPSLSLLTDPGGVTWLYWREAYYPDWHAYVWDDAGRREAPVFRAGPGFMLIPVASSSSVATVSLVWEPSVWERMAVGTSILGGLFLAAITVDGLVLGGNAFTWLRIVLTMRLPKPMLGEGPNVEWAERMSAELANAGMSLRERGLPETPMDGANAPTKGPPLAPIHETSAGTPRAGPSLGASSTEAPSADEEDLSGVDSPVAQEHAPLLKRWMETSARDDDEWARRVLRRKGR